MIHSKAKWTILVYIAAHNNLDESGQRSLNQIIKVGSTPEVKLTVLFDGKYSTARYIIGESQKTTICETLENYDSGDPDKLLETVQWAFKKFPAEKYGLILWSHGSGWRPEEIETIAKQARGDLFVDAKESAKRSEAPGSMSLFRSTLKKILLLNESTDRAICFDDGTGHSLDTLELERVAHDIQNIIGQKLDVLGMDACLMATTEIAYQLSHAVRYLIASEELVPETSWPYDTIFENLRAEPDFSAHDLAFSIVKDYVEYYNTNLPKAGDVTKVAIDLSKINNVTNAVDNLAKALISDIETQSEILWNAQLESYQKESRKKKRSSNKFRYHLWDIGSLAKNISATSSNTLVVASANALISALNPQKQTILIEEHQGNWFEYISGLSIYLVPPNKQRVTPYYANLALAKDTKWYDMLKAYHSSYA